MVDPDRGAIVRDAAMEKCKWDDGPSQCVAIMKRASLQEVVDKLWEKIPTGRTARAIFVALENPAAPSAIPNATRLQSDE